MRDDRIVEAQSACELGHAWFVDDDDPDGPSCRVAGQPASLEEGIERAAQLLAAARYPLVYGLEQTSCEAVRLAVGIADWIGAVLDTAASGGGLAGTVVSRRGEVTCSLGEIANRADLVLVWRADPLSRILGTSANTAWRRGDGLFRAAARTGLAWWSTCARTASAEEADLVPSVACWLRFRGTVDSCVRWLRGVALRADDVLAETGISLSAWQDLCDRLKRAKFAVVLFDAALSDARAGHVQVDALWALIRDLNAHTRAAAAPLLATWQCGRRRKRRLFSDRRTVGRQSGAWLSTVQSWRIQRRRGSCPLGGRRGADGRRRSADRIFRRLPAGTWRPSITVTIESGPTSRRRRRGRRFHHRRLWSGGGGDYFSDGRSAVAATAGMVSPHPSDVEILARLESRVKQLCAGPKRPNRLRLGRKTASGETLTGRSPPATCRRIATRGEEENRPLRSGANAPRRWLRSGSRRNRRILPRPIPARWRRR